MAITLAINSGSTSKKFALYSDKKVVVDFHFEQTTTGFEMCVRKEGSNVAECKKISNDEYDAAIEVVIVAINTYLESQSRKLDLIAVRIVSPGTSFQEHQNINEHFLMLLRQKEMQAPHHIPVVLHEIATLRRVYPHVRMIGVSDSAFHKDLPTQARQYDIDRSDAETYDLYRFGYHGLSVSSVLDRIHPITGQNAEKVIVVHIGGGVSVTAVQNGKSVDTSMGYTAASGVSMSNRSGVLDAGGVIALMQAKNLRPVEAFMYIHSKGGLAGLSGVADIRLLLDRKAKGEAVAAETLNQFVYQIQKQIAASTVALGGVGMVVFTGTAGIRSSELRKMIASGLTHIGLSLDTEKNDLLVGQDGVFSDKDSNVKLVVIKSNEMHAMVTVAESLR